MIDNRGSWRNAEASIQGLNNCRSRFQLDHANSMMGSKNSRNARPWNSHFKTIHQFNDGFIKMEFNVETLADEISCYRISTPSAFIRLAALRHFSFVGSAIFYQDILLGNEHNREFDRSFEKTRLSSANTVSQVATDRCGDVHS